MFSGLPQTADIGVACRNEIPLAAPVEPPSNFKSRCKPGPCGPIPRISWRRRRVDGACSQRQPPQRHGTSSDRAHVICRTTRVAAFGLAACFHIMPTADRPPRNVSLSPGDWRSSSGSAQSADPTEGKPPLALHLTRRFRPLVIPRHRRRASLPGYGFQTRGVDPDGWDPGSVRKGRSAEAGWLFAVETG